MSWMNVLRNMADGEAILEVTAMGLGVGLSALFHFFHIRHESSADRVEKTPLLTINEELLSRIKSEEHVLPSYVAISGRVIPDNELVRSRYFPDKEGVIVNFVTEERKETWAEYSRAWHESDRELSNIYETVPFSLQDKDETIVSITDPLEASGCKESLDVIHKEFRSPNSSVMDSILGVVQGNRVKGYTDTEKMLRVGTQLLGMGELLEEDGVLKLRRPSGDNNDYILTTATHAGVVKQLRSKAKLWRFLCFMFIGATATGLYFVLKRLWKKYEAALAEIRRQEEFAEVRSRRVVRRITGNASEITGHNEECVICLTNPRECVIMDCGHICACVDCIENLPTPRHCPICRAPVEKIVPLFHA